MILDGKHTGGDPWLYFHVLKKTSILQDTAPQFDLSNVAPKTAHVDRLEMVTVTHMGGSLPPPPPHRSHHSQGSDIPSEIHVFVYLN